MNRKIRKFMLMLTAACCLSSCDFLVSIDFEKPSSYRQSVSYQTSEESLTSYDVPTGAYRASNLTSEVSYSKLNYSCGLTSLPTTGTINLLVIPVEFSSHPFSSNFRNDLERCLNGNGTNDTGYWESLSSYYKKSSCGKLNLVCTIAESNYKVGKTPGAFMSKYSTAAKAIGEDVGGYCSAKAAELAVEDYKNKGNSTSKFDNDNDGYIDGLILIYSCHNTVDNKVTGTLFSTLDPEGNLFWAFTYYTELDPNSSSPNAYNFVWASYDFMYRGGDSHQIDAHTFIHETGHVLGLDDYYGNYGLNPTGGMCMMDSNILDHDPFSKTALGWTEPYVVTDSCTITLNPSESSNDCVILPVTKKGSLAFNGTPFDEYIMLDLYTPTGLNFLDAHEKYPNSPQGFTNNGIRIWHVDARIMEEYYLSDNPSYWDGSTMKFGHAWYYVAASNAYKATNASYDFSLLTLIDKNKRIFTTNSRLNAYADDNSLFRSGDSFSFEEYKDSFTKGTSMNNGGSFDWTVSVISTSNNHAVVNITRG